MKNIIFILILFGYSVGIFAQDDTKIKTYNNYVNFANESTHGLLIIHRLLETYNQEINKYVDLPGYKLNNISNSDLPRNIFKDEDHWFYETTPYEWFEKLKTDSGVIGIKNHEKLFPIAKDILRTINKVNNIRFEIADMISSKELKNTDNLDDIYSKLEEVVDLFDLYYAYILNLKTAINDQNRVVGSKSNYGKSLVSVYDNSIDVLIALRTKNNSKLINAKEGLKKSLTKMKNTYSRGFSQRKKILHSKIIKLNEDILRLTDEFINSPKVPKEYKLYGVDYYYYNIQVIDKYNRYGNGFINMLNEILTIDRIKISNRFEFPHYFKVIYPNKKVKAPLKFASKINNILSLPKSLHKRNVKVESKHIVYVDSFNVQLELFDYKIQDGDIVSLNFDGTWIYEKLSLETKPKIVNLVLNKKGKNYLVLHAENEGRQPPNTIGIRYTYMNEKKTIVLESSLKQSDIIEFRIKDNN